MFNAIFPGTPKSGLKLLATASASDSATVDFTSFIDGTYDEYLVTISDLVPATDDTNLLMRVKEAGSFRSGAGDYQYLRIDVNQTAGITKESVTSATEILLSLDGGATSRIGNAAGDGASAKIYMSNPAGTAMNKRFAWQEDHVNSGFRSKVDGVGLYDRTNGAVVGLRFLMSTGNITSAKFALYGFRKT